MGLNAIAYGAVARSGALALLRRAEAAPIFCFHNVVVDPVPVAIDRSLHMPRAAFEGVIDRIARHFTVIPLAELVRRLARGQSVRGTACLTFDDAYHGAIEHAVPLLRQRGMAATVFIVANAAARPRPFWWDAVGGATDAERERYVLELAGDAERITATTPHLPDDYLPEHLSVLRDVLDDLIEPGSHTLSHRNLSALDPISLAAELRGSRERLSTELGRPVDVIAYPYGYTTPEVAAASAREGYRAGLTLGFARASSTHHLHALPRINVPATLGLDAVECWASGIRLRGAPIRLARDLRETVPSGRGR